jgi:2-polyprenyl-3-methyl-5-hydroxy-6-metoxy-1,4-benzoquinol methylase
MNQRIEKILQYTKGPRVLDVGCVGGKLDVKKSLLASRTSTTKF